MAKDKTHYNIDPIDKEGASINIIYGERSNGKSWQVKHKKGVLNYLEATNTYHDNYKDKGNIIEELISKGKRFILVRRWREEISTDLIEKYFDDVDVMGLTDNRYNLITMFKKQLFLSNYDNESGKVTRGEKIGYVVALSTEQKYAGGSFLDVTDIIFEEFMARGVYITNEPDKLMNFYSTVDRKRGTTRMWLVGNTISRVCPYLEDWDLMEIVKHQKQGEIITKWLPTGDIDDEGINIEVKLAIEYCKSTGDSSFIVGKHKGMLNKGEWQSDPQPHLPKSLNLYRKLYKVAFQYQSFKWFGLYLYDDETHDTCWFVYPYNGEFKKNQLVFSDVVKVSNYWQRDIYNPTFSNESIKDILKTFRENKIFYATDLSGTDFKQAIDFEIRK